jgi:hypothetical protein
MQKSIFVIINFVAVASISTQTGQEVHSRKYDKCEQFDWN